MKRARKVNHENHFYEEHESYSISIANISNGTVELILNKQLFFIAVIYIQRRFGNLYYIF